MNASHPSRPIRSARSRGPHVSMRCALMLLSAVASWAICVDAVAQAYVYKPLIALEGGRGIGLGINDLGQVVGVTGNTHTELGTLWIGDSAIVLEPNVVMGYPSSVPNDINNAGQIVGSNLYNNAVMWSGGVRTDLPTLGGIFASAQAINNAGQIVGFSSTAGDGFIHATLWSGGKVTDLGAPGAPNSYAQDINDSGQIVGRTENVNLMRAILWNGTTAVALSTPAGSNSFAAAINNAGEVVGVSGIDATLWNGTTRTTLPRLSEFVDSTSATDINNRGQVVGVSTFDDGDHATLWNGKTVVDLNSFLDKSTVAAGWVLDSAQAINDKGWITGSAVNNLTFEITAYLLRPVSAVPQPPSSVLMGVGLLLLIGVARKRARGAPTELIAA